MKYVRALKKQYDDVIGCRSYGNCMVVKNGKYGLVNRYTGKELIAVKYDEMREIDSLSAFVVKVGEHYGVVNNKGTVLVPITYDQIDEHRCAGVLQKNGQYAFYHLGDNALKKTTRITPLKYDTATPFSYEGFSVVSVAGKYGFVNRELEEWIAPYYDTATPFQSIHSRVNYHYLSIVSVNGQYGMINERNEIIVPMEYDDLAFMNVRNKVLAKSQGKYGILDYVKRKIKAITPFQYDAITAFDDDMAGVCVRKQNTLESAQWGFIDATGQEVISPQFDQIIYPFLKGRAYVEQNGERFFINKTGQKITRDIPNTLSAKVKVLDENVGKLSEYLRNHADVPQLQQSSRTVFYWQTPYDLTLLDNVPDDYPYAEEFTQYNRLREKMRLERVDDLDDLLHNQLHYPVLSVGFFSALPFNQGATNVCFFIIRENNQVYLTWTYSFLPQTYVELLTQSQPFDLDALSESEIALLDNLLAHIEMACNDWEIATEKNQGIFVRHEFDEQADVNRLIELLDDNIGLTKQAKTRLKKKAILN